MFEVRGVGGAALRLGKNKNNATYLLRPPSHSPAGCLEYFLLKLFSLLDRRRPGSGTEAMPGDVSLQESACSSASLGKSSIKENKHCVPNSCMCVDWSPAEFLSPLPLLR